MMADMRRPDGATILHADLDAFYASVALLKAPHLGGKPVAVGGGVVLSCTYEARAMGVRSAMPIGQARRLCPSLIVLDSDFGDFVAYSDRVFEVFREFTPIVEPLSIDEAFLDVSGAIHLFGPPEEIGRSIRRRVREATQLPVSVGAARTKFLAKIASQVAKPDGMVVVEPGTEIEFLHPLPVERLWGVGPVTTDALAGLGIETIGDIAATSPRLLEDRLGRARASHLLALSMNNDARIVETARRAGSVGSQSAFGGDHRDPEELKAVIARLSSRVGARLRNKGRRGRTVTVRARFTDMASVTRSKTLRAGTASSAVLYRTGAALVERVLEDHPERGLNLLGISVSNLERGAALQLEFGLDGEGASPGNPKELELQALDEAVDALRAKFGRRAVGPGSDLLGITSDFAEGLSDIMTRHEAD
jgi:DNA polymerase IV